MQQITTWVDLTDDEILECAPINGATVESVAIAVAAKLKEKNTPPVVPQGEPVAWMYKFKTEDPILCKVKRDWADNHSQWKETPLYTAPPSVEALMQELSDSEHDVQRLLDLVGKLDEEREAAIEATKEKAAKVCEEKGRNWNYEDGFCFDCAAAIRSMK